MGIDTIILVVAFCVGFMIGFVYGCNRYVTDLYSIMDKLDKQAQKQKRKNEEDLYEL